MNKLFKILACLGILATSQQANASGFGLLEQSASAMGTAYAGTAANIEDATTVWWNPAGMTRFCNQQYVLVFATIVPNSKFHNRGSTLAPGLGGAPLTGNNGGNAGDIGYLPSSYYVRPLGCGWAFGLSINTPFGLSTSYHHHWKGRYYARHSKILTINIQPSLAYQVTDNLSVGVGFDAMYIRSKFTNDVDFGSILFAATQGGLGTPQGMDGEAKLRGDSWGIGGNVGFLYDINCNTTVGLHYRSEIKEVLRGNVSYKNVPTPLASSFPNARTKSNAVLPSSLTFSAVHHINCRWDVMCDIAWTKWSTIKELKVTFSSAQPPAVNTFRWQDTMRYSLGTTYQYWDCLKLRMGVAYDKNPYPNKFYRNPRLPDTNRIFAACGLKYDWDCFNFDVAYLHLFTKNPKIDKSNDIGPGEENFFLGELVGKYRGHADILTVQAAYNF